MSPSPHEVFVRYFEQAHDAVLWKLDGVDEYDLRRPLTPTGTNLLGIVKHLAWVELGYFGDVFGRPLDVGPPPDRGVWNSDMFATADESVDQIVELFRTAGRHTIEALTSLPLDTPGNVPWWGENGAVTLHLVAVHMVTEVNRHLGQLDILRESLDGGAGHRADVDNLPPMSADEWARYRDLVEQTARDATAG